MLFLSLSVLFSLVSLASYLSFSFSSEKFMRLDYGYLYMAGSFLAYFVSSCVVLYQVVSSSCGGTSTYLYPVS